ncbi:MAG TPA: hypothetical protein VJH03_00435 [Blastocatellia bacterium]|nr:hypothetical protein [Blastocatellia bacterium]
MASHLSDIGFKVDDEDSFADLAEVALREGERLPAPNGTYIRWSPGAGVELWLQLDRGGDVIGLNPHFSGDGRVRAGIQERVTGRMRETELDGGLCAWANPSDDAPESGDYPFVFDLPDYALTSSIQIPSIVTIQLAAFAHEITGYDNDDAYYAAQPEELKFASESFIPAGLFSPDGDRTDPPQAQAIFSGHILKSSSLINPHSGRAFWSLRVQTLGAEIGVVADPSMVSGSFRDRGVVHGVFWLSGRLIDVPE